ncbi:CHASE2 domain-containing protein [Lacibacter sp. H407]|uniref:CHASE2 domain-containing protein n=1 Tax=Lacibacter sp. H407 TaxID=3133423 RepID=UPI0030BDF586
MRSLKRFFGEYLLLNCFIFGCVSLLSLVILNVSFFDPFTEAFHDFTLTDLYYTKAKDRNTIYKDNIVLVNLENRNRKEIALLLQQLQTGKPKTIAIDAVFAGRKNEADSLLQQTFQLNNNYIVSYIADFEKPEQSIYSDSFFTNQKDGYANIVGDAAEFSTIRYYYPFSNDQEAFSSSILKHYDSTTYQKLKKRAGQKTEIHYFGNLSNFQFYDFDEVMDPAFAVELVKDKIVLIGFLGLPSKRNTVQLDEDKLFTPLNPRLSGRSYPDMYGTVIHANILRMALEDDHIRVIPSWLTAIISFLLIWFILPLICGLFFKGDLWFNSVGTLLQLIGGVVIVFITLISYSSFRLKFDPGLVLACLVLLPTFINLYEVLLNFLRHKLKLRFNSAFLGTNKHD